MAYGAGRADALASGASDDAVLRPDHIGLAAFSAYTPCVHFLTHAMQPVHLTSFIVGSQTISSLSVPNHFSLLTLQSPASESSSYLNAETFRLSTGSPPYCLSLISASSDEDLILNPAASIIFR